MDILSDLLGSGSMEMQYLQIIALLDRAETLMHSLVRSQAMTPMTAVSIAEAKQNVIDDFAKANREGTLEGIRKEYPKKE